MQCKSYSHFSAKTIRILCTESAKTVNEMTLNELVKLMTLRTTGPSILVFFTQQISTLCSCIQNLKTLALIGAATSVTKNFNGEKEK